MRVVENIPGKNLRAHILFHLVMHEKFCAKLSSGIGNTFSFNILVAKIGLMLTKLLVVNSNVGK